MIDIIAAILILYLIYKLVFDFIVPVAKTTSQFKQHVNQMHNMQEQMGRQQSQKQQAPAQKKPPVSSPGGTTTTDGEYIDFEEMK